MMEACRPTVSRPSQSAPPRHPKGVARNQAACDNRQDWDRNRIDRVFNETQAVRRIATRYHKAARSSLAVSGVKLWLPYFVSRP